MNKIITMKRKLMGFVATALVAFTFSCDDIELTPEFKKSDVQITLSSSASSVAVAASDSLADALSFTWNDPEYVVGLSGSKFTIKVGPEGGNFTSFLSKEFSGVLTGSLLGKELNGMALKFGGVIDAEITLDAMVVASQSNNNEPKNSNVVQIIVTPYGDLALTPSSTSVVTNAAISSEEALEVTWSTAFVGFNGVKTYVLEHAEGDTDFASPTSVDVTEFTKSFTHFELNKIALAYGIAAGAAGTIDFRIKATNELGTVLYSNIATVSVTPYIAFNSIGIIGDATPGDWATDTDMYRPDATKPTEWTVTVYLMGGKAAKFRADDDWVDNWGSTDFPSGTGTQNGSDIPVSTSGYYKINLDVGTGVYSFTQVTTTVYTNVSLIGEQSNWGPDIADLTKDPTNDQVWTGIVNLEVGNLKFRADHDWATNWGIESGTSASSLSGYSTQNGGDMEITEAADYFIYINVATGEYFLGKPDRNVPIADIGLIGDATPGGWNDDTNLIKNPANPFKWSGRITLNDGSSKFRADNDWAVNWGSDTFPGGTGLQNGPDIPTDAGIYFITFNTATGEYYFLK
jgi:hypothetical protein